MKQIKKIFIAFCVVFTLVALFSSFVKKDGTSLRSARYDAYGVDEIVQNGQKYIVVTTSRGGVAICKE